MHRYIPSPQVGREETESLFGRLGQWLLHHWQHPALETALYDIQMGSRRRSDDGSVGMQGIEQRHIVGEERQVGIGIGQRRPMQVAETA